MRRDAAADEVRELLEDCDALLAGRYVEHLEWRQRLVPAWAWTNLLAHGSADALAEAAGRDRIHPSAQWFRARAYLAGEVLALSERGIVELADIQREVLIPLELRLADGDARWLPMPRELVRLVVEALDTHVPVWRRRAAHRRPANGA